MLTFFIRKLNTIFFADILTSSFSGDKYMTRNPISSIKYERVEDYTHSFSGNISRLSRRGYEAPGIFS